MWVAQNTQLNGALNAKGIKGGRAGLQVQASSIIFIAAKKGGVFMA